MEFKLLLELITTTTPPWAPHPHYRTHFDTDSSCLFFQVPQGNVSSSKLRSCKILSFGTLYIRPPQMMIITQQPQRKRRPRNYPNTKRQSSVLEVSRGKFFCRFLRIHHQLLFEITSKSRSSKPFCSRQC